MYTLIPDFVLNVCARTSIIQYGSLVIITNGVA